MPIVEITGDRSEQLGIQLGLGAAADGVVNSAGTSFTNLGLSLRQVLAIVGSPAVAGSNQDKDPVIVPIPASDVKVPEDKDNLYLPFDDDYKPICMAAFLIKKKPSVFAD